MKKLNKRIIGILGTAALALSVFAIPAFALTPSQSPMGLTGKMQSFMNSDAMQTIHNSQAMQEAMTTGDVTKMTEAMNTVEMKEIMGEEHINQMTEFMNSSDFQAMHGQGGMMSGTSGNMMGNFTNIQ